MGKQKRQRRKPHKENPTGLPSVQEFELNEEFTEGDREKILQNVYDDIQSYNLEEKLSALQILASMSCDTSMAKQIAKDGIAKIIGPLLLDHNSAIRTNVAHTLREIAENGREEVCSDLIKDDIITPLIALLRQYYSDWKPKEVENEKVTFVQAVSLLWTLCANDENAIKRANEEDLASLLIKFLDIDIYGIEIVTIVTRSMICLSDENAAAINKIKQSESILSSLLDLKADDDKTTSKILFLKTCIADVLINISNYMDNNRIHVFRKVLLVLSDVLAIDHRQILSCLTSILPHEYNASSNDKKKTVQENRKILEMQEQALQILANLCFEYEDNDSDIDFETMEIESECLDDDSMNEDLKTMSTFPVELVEVMNDCNLIDKIWDKTKFVVENSQEILDQTEEGKDTLKQFYDIQCAAYLCLNNLLPSIEVDAFGGVNNLFGKWMEILTELKRITKKNVLKRVELAEAGTAAMRAILQRLVEVRANIFELNQLTCDVIQPILNDVHQCVSVNVRVNTIRILCNLVQMLNGKDSKNYETIKFVSMFLLDIAKTETRVWVIAESIDAIMDIYTEDEIDHIAADIKLIPKLLSIMPHFKSKMHQQKKHLQDGTFVISTVNANLMRFIKYKQKRLGIVKQK